MGKPAIGASGPRALLESAMCTTARALKWPRVLATATLLLILALATYLRLHGIGTEPFWMDEGYTMAYTQPPFFKMLSYIATRDVHPPLYYIFMKGWRVFGDSETFLRMPSAIFGIAAVWAMWATVREHWGVLAAAGAALVLATSESAIWYSQEVRMYSLVLLLTVLSLRYFLRFLTLFESSPQSRAGSATADGQAYLKPVASRGDCVGLALANVALLYTHNVAAFVWGAQLLVGGILFVAHLARRGALRGGPHGQWLLCQAAIGLSYLPWFIILVGQAANVRARFWVGPPDASTVQGVFGMALAWRTWMFPAAATFVGAVPFLAAVKVVLSPRDLKGAALAAAAGLPIFASYMYSISAVPIMVDRTLLFVAIPLIVLVGSFLAMPDPTHHWGLRGLGVLRVAVGLVIVAGLVNFNLKAWSVESRAITKEDFRSAAQRASTAVVPGATALVFNNSASQAAFDYYFKHYDMGVREYGLPCHYLNVPEGNANLEPTVTEGSIRQLAAKLSGLSRAILVRSHWQYPDPYQTLKAYFDQNWNFEQDLSTQGVEVYVYTR